MSDQTLNRFIASGTAAERGAFVPSPPTPASGPDQAYFWYETDTGNTYAWAGSWEQVNGATISDGDYGAFTVTGGVAALDAGVVTLANMANMATASVIYRKTAGTGAPEVQTLATLKTDLGLGGTATGTNTGDQTITLTGEVTGSGTGTFAATIGTGVVSYSKIQDVTATDKLLGRSSSGSGSVEEIACTAAGRALLDDANAAAQRTTLGATTAGGNIFTLTNPSAITFLRVNADNTVDALSAAAFRTAIGATGTGDLLSTNNLSDVASASTSLSNLGGQSRAPTIQSVTSAATVTPTFSDDQVNITAQAAGLTLANPTGTTIPALGISIRIKDNGTARSIAYGTQYRAIGVTLPTTTVISKTLYLGMIYNSTDTKWDVVAVAQEA